MYPDLHERVLQYVGYLYGIPRYPLVLILTIVLQKYVDGIFAKDGEHLVLEDVSSVTTPPP